MGDGSYMFANPTVCHQVAEALDLPVLVLVLNTAEWGAVRASVKGLYPEGYATKSIELPSTDPETATDFTPTTTASPAWARRLRSTAVLRSHPASALPSQRGA